MKIAVYPGSFNPFHDGHADILDKALMVFDKVVIAIGQNPEKPINYLDMKNRVNNVTKAIKEHPYTRIHNEDKIQVVSFEGLLKDFIDNSSLNINAIVRGLRNSQDFEFEKVQQYHNEDLRLSTPFVYFIAHRHFTHVSSSAIRMIEKFKGK